VKVPIVRTIATVLVLCAISLAADSDTDNSGTQQSVKKGNEQPQPCNCGSNNSWGALYCPLFDIMSMGSNDLYFCNYYPNGCNGDPPQDAYYAAPPGQNPGDCDSQPANCFPGYMFSRVPIQQPIDVIKPLPKKVSTNNLPFKDVEVGKYLEYGYFYGAGGRNITVCIYPLVHFDAKQHERCRYFHLGLEIDPATCPVTPKLLTDVQTLSTFLYSVQRGHEFVYLICTP